jgi:sec-independent protein translocase protein TatC
MTGFYPEESRRLDVIGHLEELRRRLLICLLALALFGGIFFFLGDSLLVLVRRPIRGWVDTLVFIGPAEAFVAYVKIALLAGLIAAFPVILAQLWCFLAPALSPKMRHRLSVWIGASLALFVAGVLFSYFAALPSALGFLVGFGKKIAHPQITIDQYVSFFTAFMLIGGFMFEIPVVIGMLADLGWVKSDFLKSKRAVAFVIVLIVAAVVTPTQDIFNMLLFAVPMAALYEFGILIAVFTEKSKSQVHSKQNGRGDGEASVSV